eukprot:CAMPEP_0185163060 /NCGR_PEP_ID=MMETSP1139-20130426/7477_1 /TAXON_ID=298111 /ORGANISM="Pavlova sp., Strain CCMP459" /LENGTH=271 /DNA_ID=CAMNT_0027728409 /DNA_START=114 /DNA_END=927 /DNA_ORIENTATION=-
MSLRGLAPDRSLRCADPQAQTSEGGSIKPTAEGPTLMSRHLSCDGAEASAVFSTSKRKPLVSCHPMLGWCQPGRAKPCGEASRMDEEPLCRRIELFKGMLELPVRSLGEVREGRVHALMFQSGALEEAESVLACERLALLALDIGALAEICLVGDNHASDKAVNGRHARDTLEPFAQVFERVWSCYVVHEHDRARGVPVVRHHLSEEVLPCCVEDEELHARFRVRHLHLLHAKIHADGHEVVLGELLAVALEHLRQRALPNARVAHDGDLA